MKINEVTQMSDKKLFETINKDNNTGFLTEDLVDIVRQHESGNWVDHTPDEFDAYLKELCGK